jgi:hypothetical protein
MGNVAAILYGWILVCFTMEVSAAPRGSYRLDLEGAENLGLLLQRGDVPNRIEVYKAGPAQYINTKVLPQDLMKTRPSFVTTNRNEISNLVEILTWEDNKERILGVSKHAGYTYHILLFEDAKNAVMHFRIFEPTDIKTPWCDVYPRSETGFGFFSDRVGSWLGSHVKAAPGARSG